MVWTTTMRNAADAEIKLLINLHNIRTMNQLVLFLALWVVMCIFYMLVAGAFTLLLGFEPSRKDWLGMALLIAAVSMAQAANFLNSQQI
jgi:uncharacterized membrane protein YesL